MASVFLLTGRPGTGKTTIIRETLSVISVTKGGFYTQEIKEGGMRKGFKIITLDGVECILSHIDFPKSKSVGKYGVSIENLEAMGVPSLERAINDCELVVIDEVGKMELLSSRFREIVLKAIESNRIVLGTIMQSPNVFTDRIKQHSSVKLYNVTVANRGQILKTLVHDLTEIINEDFSKTAGHN
jgi:nucleoside-triphosphatase